MKPEGPLLVVCLCAAWCGACREYRPLFESLAAQFTGQAEFAWVDVEDEADGLGELDVDNFPTLMLAADNELVFLGPVTPLASTAVRLVRSALAGELDPEGAASAPAGLALRVRAILGSRVGTAS